MMKKSLCLATMILAMCSASFAEAASPQPTSNQTTSIATPVLLKGGSCRGILGRMLECDYLGKITTIKQIYDQGWRVVAQVNKEDAAYVVTLIIEEQK